MADMSHGDHLGEVEEVVGPGEAGSEEDLAHTHIGDVQPANDFDLLKQALLNERVAPDILDYQGELVQRVKLALEDAEHALDELEADRARGIEKDAMGLDRDRMRYLLKAYLRARAHKVERLAGALLLNDAMRDQLSPQEQALVHSLFVLKGRHLKTTVLDALPRSYQSLTKQHEGDPQQSMIEQPQLDTFVFCRSLVHVGHVPDGDHGETVELRAGDLHIIRYPAVAELVRAGQVCLL